MTPAPDGSPAPDARLTSFTRDGLVFDVVDAGPLDGDPVVLLHGFPERASSWAAVAPLLHAAGLRTFAPDQRGYSPRARPPRVRDYGVLALADDVAALIGAIGEHTGRPGPVHLVGHDWGSAVGWAVASVHPDLLRSWTAVSVPHLAAFLRAEVTSTQILKSAYFLPFWTPRLVPALARRRGGLVHRALAASGMTPAEVDRFHAEMVEDAALPTALNWYRAMPFGVLSERATTRTRITVPTTLVWSDGDVAIGRAGVDGTARWVAADYRLVVLPGVSHWIPTQAPEALAEAVLDRVSRVSQASPDSHDSRNGGAGAR
ncbi:alpha/beta fold hydrolase [Nocardioides sp. TRM66260-LWL]|uniref:alpha/beta fold hydrolase n=1 Tax=Nocardioides sp. TRM66260-LWL TaxID=2874478 RepID=UPI001CC54DE4|nr:alpha/beta fold hydrolase [Nocardioides sp. TRM66260-LWL]MBZ5734648.1 alpha/beta fold hydrolase [Nocardioides sp. TRM66260-LWL]